MQSRARLATRGFTLIEVMIAVVIIGILAGLGVYGVGKYVRASKSSEATRMIASIKTAQESYKGETFNYLDVSGAKSLATSTFYPRTAPDSKIHGWGDVSTGIGQRWRELGVRPDGPVYYAYGCAAGSPSDAVLSHGHAVETIANWPTNVNAPWYVVRAVGNLDGDTTYSNFVSASFTGQVFVEKEDE